MYTILKLILFYSAIVRCAAGARINTPKIHYVDYYTSCKLTCPSKSVRWIMISDSIGDTDTDIVVDGTLQPHMDNDYIYDTFNSTLHIINVTRHTVGVYRCIIPNGYNHRTVVYDFVIRPVIRNVLQLPKSISCVSTLIKQRHARISWSIGNRMIYNNYKFDTGIYSGQITILSNGTVLYFNPTYKINETVTCDTCHTSVQLCDRQITDVYRYSPCESNVTYCAHVPNSKCVSDKYFTASCVSYADIITGNDSASVRVSIGLLIAVLVVALSLISVI